MTECLSRPRLLPNGRGPEDVPSRLPDLLARRRTIRRLVDGPLRVGALDLLADAIGRTPAAFGVQPWRVVLVRDRRDEFWDLVESGFSERLAGERLARYLDRLDGFAGAAVVALVYEETGTADRLRDGWSLPERTETDFVQQGLGMVQFSIWLAATDLGLAAFAGLDHEHPRLVSIMPIGHADEEPRPATSGAGWTVALDRAPS